MSTQATKYRTVVIEALTLLSQRRGSIERAEGTTFYFNEHLSLDLENGFCGFVWRFAKHTHNADECPLSPELYATKVQAQLTRVLTVMGLDNHYPVAAPKDHDAEGIVAAADMYCGATADEMWKKGEYAENRWNLIKEIIIKHS